MRTPHLSVRQGKRIMIKLKQGGTIIAKFQERKGKYIFLTDGRKIRAVLIKSLKIYKD